MSYILEALKKAQAERQIGSAPTIHAPTLASAPAGQGARSKRTPVIVAMALMAAAIAGLATMLVRQQPPANPPPATVAPTVAPQAAAAPVAVVAAPEPAAGADSAPLAAPTAAPTAEPAAAGQPPARKTVQQPPPAATTPPPSRAADTPPAQRSAGLQASAGRGGDQAQAAPVAPPAPVPTPAPIEEQVQSLRELPEPIQRAIPQITLGGYMYSKNPADRLLLIDKVLRREGEEVAPGLILDKLQPKQAVFSFRGYRYRVPL
ncbi:general secretion pathway protein B [Duganella sp. CF458]|uniref:general secretion pathway protein GspB n=1 Tax=Duganella sp. CF458 TaxID=1884368 RepID=UPI0008E0CACF|nr:general secretion pathway protein GspB [Duganella sp. CF458]SFG72500.1 general secretion pathway protein B [Duganella sp. CF458]